MKVYISGAISSDPNFIAKFEWVQYHLEQKYGWKIANPIDTPYRNYKQVMDDDLKLLMECDAIFMMRDYVTSQGARLEHLYATTVGMPVYYEGEEYGFNSSMPELQTA